MRLEEILFHVRAATLKQEYVLRESYPNSPQERTIGIERLYQTKITAAYWIHERMYPLGGGNSDEIIPLSEQEAKTWLQDRFGHWKGFHKLFDRVFSARPPP